MKTFRFASLLLVVVVGVAISATETHAQIISPTGQFPPPLGVPLFDLSNAYGRRQYDLYKYKEHVMVRLKPLYAKHQGEPAWVASWQYLLGQIGIEQTCPLQAEDGDIMGLDNNGRGSPEPVHVEGYFKDDGSYVPSTFRALPEFGD